MRDHGEGLVLGIDLGTSAVKVGLFNLLGQPRAVARRSYPTVERLDGSAEQDPETWWAATCDALRDVLSATAAHQPILALCVGGQGPTLVLVDEKGNATAPAITWQDRRPLGHVNDLVTDIAAPLAAYSLVPRLSWALTSLKGAIAHARWALQSWDFLAFRLGGNRNPIASCLRGDAVWNPDWLASIDPKSHSLLPPQTYAGTAYSVTAGEWSQSVGLPDGIPIVGGVNDGIGALLGSNTTQVGRALDVGGTSGGLAVCWNTPLQNPGVQAWPGLRPNTWFVGGALAATGRAVEWWTSASGQGSVPNMLSLAAESQPGANGVLFLPFLAGERAPLWDTDVRGAFVGLSLVHTASDLARAVLEGSALALRLLLDAVVTAGARVDQLLVVGAPATSQLWNQTKADITGLRVAVPQVTDASLLGNAICAAVGAGEYPDLLTAADAMVHLSSIVEPREFTRTIYQTRFDNYRAAYRALRNLPPAGL